MEGLILSQNLTCLHFAIVRNLTQYVAVLPWCCMGQQMKVPDLDEYFWTFFKINELLSLLHYSPLPKHRLAFG